MTWQDVERAKELVVVAVSCAPDEWEGGDSVKMSSKCIRFLAQLYPDIEALGTGPNASIPLRKVKKVITAHPPETWRAVYATIVFGEQEHNRAARP